MPTSKISTTTKDYHLYQVKPEQLTEELIHFFIDAAFDLSQRYKTKYAWDQFKIKEYAKENLIIVCAFKWKPVGFIFARPVISLFDNETRILFQDVLYSTKPKATHLLLTSFLTFGKKHADHVVTGIGAHTNIKPRSLEKLGFKKLETLYRLEV